MGTETATDRVKRDLFRVLDKMHTDLDRVEILTSALSAFSMPIPEYEPEFRHLRPALLGAREIGFHDR
jgi:hypothetical protein